VAGWSRRAVARLRSIVQVLSGPVARIAPTLGASSFAIGVSFPWGIQISLEWGRRSIAARSDDADRVAAPGRVPTRPWGRVREPTRRE
jgi:hypothetical protein